MGAAQSTEGEAASGGNRNKCASFTSRETFEKVYDNDDNKDNAEHTANYFELEKSQYDDAKSLFDLVTKKEEAKATPASGTPAATSGAAAKAAPAVEVKKTLTKGHYKAFYEKKKKDVENFFPPLSTPKSDAKAKEANRDKKTTPEHFVEVIFKSDADDVALTQQTLLRRWAAEWGTFHNPTEEKAKADAAAAAKTAAAKQTPATGGATGGATVGTGGATATAGAGAGGEHKAATETTAATLS